MKITNYKQNDIIFREGNYEPCMYSIAEGSVGIYVNFGDSKEEKQIAVMNAGQFFGEMGLFESKLRSATAVALEDVRLYQITLENISEFFRTQPQQLLGIMRVLSNRVRSLTNDYMDVCRSIAEAAEASRKGTEKSSSLKAKLAKFVNDYIRPVLTPSGISYDIDPFMIGVPLGGVNRKLFNRSEIIFRQGDSSDCMYDIMKGRVGIYMNYGAAGEKLLTILKEDQFFGEMGLLDSAPRSATAVALDDKTELRMISAADFDSFMAEKPTKVVEIIQHLSNRLRELTNDYMEACKAVSEAVEQEEKGADPKNGWLRSSMDRFINDYCEAMQYISTHPEMNAYYPFDGHYH